VWSVCLLSTWLPAGCSGSKLARRADRDTADQLTARARAAADKGDAASAEYFLTAAVDSNPRDCETRLELSEMLMEHGSLERATLQLRRLVEQNADDPRAHVRLARVLYLQRDKAEAREQVATALELDPENPQAWLLRARLERDAQSDSRALAACYKVLAALPDEPEARLLAAQIHVQRGNPQQASPLLRSLLNEASDCPLRRTEATWLLGQCYALEARWDEAAETLGSVISSRENSAADWYQLAYARYRSGDYEAARQAIGATLSLAPTNAEALQLARLLEGKRLRTVSAAEDDAPDSGSITHAAWTTTAPAIAALPAP
jgi:tetratricopeptide (TPR) repeat protein